MSNGMSVIKNICLKNLTLHVPPFKVTQCHWDQHKMINQPPMTSY